MPTLTLKTGVFTNTPPQTIRRISDLAQIFADQNAAKAIDPETKVYELHGSPAEVEGPPQLLYATTVLHPGQVGDEYFMTRGHFHTNPDRGEFLLTLSGVGALILMDRARQTWQEPMTEGSVHTIDGHHAHRVANTGNTPLVFLVTWLSDCGHDYESIKTQGFSKRLIATPNGSTLSP